MRVAIPWLGGLSAMALLASAVSLGVLDSTQTWQWGLAGGGAIGLGLWATLCRAQLRALMADPGTRRSWSAGMLTALGLALAVAINVLATEHDQRWDMTSSAKHTLSPQTVKVLNGLNREVQIVGFFGEATAEEMAFRDLVDGYSAHTGHIQLELHDPLREPLAAQQHEITHDHGTVILRAGDDVQRLESSFDEEALTNGLIRVTTGLAHPICFTDGHGELDVTDSTTGAGLGLAMSKLRGQNHSPRAITLIREGKVPGDCDVVVVAGPQVDWIQPELEMLAAHVVEGGALLVMLDPTFAPTLADDLGRYGLSVGDDILLETHPTYQPVGGDISYIILDDASFDLHELTAGMKSMAVLRMARSVARADDVPVGLVVQELAHTTQLGWAETNLDLFSSAPVPNPEVDRVGRVPVMAVAELGEEASLTIGNMSLGGSGGAPKINAQPGGRIVVLGDSDLATNEMLNLYGNLDLTLNAIAWLAGEEDQVSIRPNPAARGSLTMNSVQGLIVWLISLLVVPGFFLLEAFNTWRRRRAL
jgi:hypothetical protein